MRVSSLGLIAMLALAGCSTVSGVETSNYWPTHWFTSGAPAQPQKSLLGTNWVVTDLAGASAPRDMQMTFNVNADSKINGRAACNGYFGSAKINKTKLELEGIGSTKMMCTQPVMAAESQFLDVLNRTRGYTIGDTDDKLRLVDSSGTELAVLKRN